jgi:hypothetical protein
MSLLKTFREAFDGFGWELLDGIRAKANERISDAVFEERILGIEKTTIAMIEAAVTEETIIKMLQKHWDLRLSEATEFIEHAKSASDSVCG